MKKNIKIILTITLLISNLIISIPIKAQSYSFDWVNISQDIHQQIITTDSEGSIYVLDGIGNGTYDIDPSQNVYNISGNGLTDYYVAKYDSNGLFVWGHSFGGPGSDDVGNITFGNNENLIITGDFMNVVDFDPGNSSFNFTAGSPLTTVESGFVQALDKDGNFLWAKRIGMDLMGAWGNVKVNKSATDQNGDVYITGTYYGTVDFDPSSGTYLLTANSIAKIFILKLDANGNFIWVKDASNNGSYYGFGSIEIDNLNNLYVSGNLTGTLDVNLNSGTYNLNCSECGFLVKYTSNGDFVWAKKLEHQYSTHKLYNNAIYITGTFSDTVDFNPNTGVDIKISNGEKDMYLLKLNVYGDFEWVKTFDSFQSNFLTALRNSLSINSNGKLTVTGGFVDSVDFDPGPSSHILFFDSVTTAGKNSVILELDSNGNFLWVKATDNLISNIHCDIKGNIITNGTFTDIVDFDYGNSLHEVSNVNSFDYYLHKLKPCSLIIDTQTVYTCAPFLWVDGNAYSTDNNTATFYVSSNSTFDCDSLLVLNLNILEDTYSSIDISTCSNYISPSNNFTYNSSGTYLDTIPNAQGCDSIITINLTILPSQQIMNTSYSCNPLDTGTQVQTFTNQFGCDSVLVNQTLLQAAGSGIVRGTITDAQGNAVILSRVYLIEYNSIDNELTAVDTFLTDGYGKYQFNAPVGVYFLKVAPDDILYADLLPTYYNNSTVFQYAQYIVIDSCDNEIVDFNPVYGVNPGGSGFIGGFISNGAGKNEAFLPVENLELVLYNQSTNTPIEHTKTDEDGYFSFDLLPFTSYAIYTDKPLIENGLAPLVSIDLNESRKDSLLFILEETKLSYTGEQYTSINTSKTDVPFEIYPNPASNYISISVPNQLISQFNIVNSLGQKFIMAAKDFQNKTLNITQLPQGVYFLHIETENGQTGIKKFVKK